MTIRFRSSLKVLLLWSPLVLFAAVLLPFVLLGVFGPGRSATQLTAVTADGWTIVASVSPRTSRAFDVSVQFASSDPQNMLPPPRPLIRADMPEHGMSRPVPVQAVGSTRFEAYVEPSMPGDWTIAVIAGTQTLQIPVYVQ